MKSEDIRNFAFDKGAFGYKVEEVTACLQDIAAYAQELEHQNESLEQELSSLREKLSRLEEDEESVKQIIVSAQKLSSTVVSDAKVKAEELLSDAQAQSRSIIEKANQKSQLLISDATQKAETVEKESIESARAISIQLKKEADLESKRLQKMKGEVSAFKSNLLSLYKSHLDLISKLPEQEIDIKHHAFDVDQEKGKISKESKNDNKNEEKILDKETISSEQQGAKIKESTMNDETKTTVFNLNHKGEEKVSPFKITITEKDASETSYKKVSEENHNNKSDFKSRFGELKFGENAK